MGADDLFATITDQLIADIETGAAGTWRMPWHVLADAGTPTSVDQRLYRGANALWLAMVSAAHDWASGVYGTYRAWQRHGAQVRRGQHATQVVLWKPIRNATSDDGTEIETRRPRLFARAYNVFAAEQCDGADDILARQAERLTRRDTPERVDAAERYFAQIPAVVVDGGNRAYYQPSTDTIHLPRLEQFRTAAHYYGVRAHETVHWTGHRDRLDRDLAGRFGSDRYAAEELVAELGAAMWCAQAGLSAVTRHDHAAYLDGWLRVLRHDPRSLVTVAGRAQAAVDHLNQLTAPAEGQVVTT